MQLADLLATGLTLPLKDADSLFHSALGLSRGGGAAGGSTGGGGVGRGFNCVAVLARREAKEAKNGNLYLRWHLTGAHSDVLHASGDAVVLARCKPSTGTMRAVSVDWLSRLHPLLQSWRFDCLAHFMRNARRTKLSMAICPCAGFLQEHFCVVRMSGTSVVAARLANEA